jgi:hypothetical protein
MTGIEKDDRVTVTRGGREQFAGTGSEVRRVDGSTGLGSRSVLSGDGGTNPVSGSPEVTTDSHHTCGDDYGDDRHGRADDEPAPANLSLAAWRPDPAGGRRRRGVQRRSSGWQSVSSSGAGTTLKERHRQ